MTRRGTWPSAQQIADAAVLRHFDPRPDVAIAAELGICRRTLLRWTRREDFQGATAAVVDGRAWGRTRYQVGLGPQLAAMAAQLEHRPRRRRQWRRRRRQSRGSVAWEWPVGEG